MSTTTRIESEPSEPASPSRSTWIAFGALALLTTIGWIYLGLMIAEHMAGHGGLAAFGPGMGLLDRFMPVGGIDPTLAALLDALCRPRFGQAPLARTAAEATVAILMWVAMVMAMMLPTAVPMLMSATGIADARRHRRAAAPLMVLAGYLAVWIAFAILAAAAQIVLTRLALLDAAMTTASPLFAGAVFVAAGAYQFSPVKDRCVANCRQPGPFFAAAEGGGFRLGLRQGRDCVGCCWAMMLLMFSVGTMNVLWMAGLGLVMAAEKIAGTPRLSRILGSVLLAVGAATVVVAVLARWPA
jgi:predicted metal-binding membrane protein